MGYGHKNEHYITDISGGIKIGNIYRGVQVYKWDTVSIYLYVLSCHKWTHFGTGKWQGCVNGIFRWFKCYDRSLLMINVENLFSKIG